MSGSSLVKMALHNDKNIFISNNVQITYWKVVYHSHTNFAMETIETHKSYPIGDRALIFILGFRDKKGYGFVRELFNKMHDDYNLLEKWVEFDVKL